MINFRECLPLQGSRCAAHPHQLPTLSQSLRGQHRSLINNMKESVFYRTGRERQKGPETQLALGRKKLMGNLEKT